MEMPKADDLSEYYERAESWAAERERAQRSANRFAWIVAGVAAAIALFEAVAIVALTPLKTVVPYTLLVDRQTGYVQALKPLEREIIEPDAALTRSFLAQYVIARESFDIDSLRDDYRKVALWSGGEARRRYLAEAQASNPASMLATLPRRAVVQAEIRSITSLNADTALVRFSTVRSDPGGERQDPASWAAIVRYRFSAGEMSAADRLVNPLGFQVVRYRRSAEIAPTPPAESRPFVGSAAPPVERVPPVRRSVP